MKTVMTLLSDGEFEVARSQAIEAVRNEPEAVGLRLQLAEVHLCAGNFKAAEELLRGLAQLCPDDERESAMILGAVALAEQVRARVAAGEGEPDLIVGDQPTMRRRLEAWRLAAAGRGGEAATLLKGLDGERADRPGSWDDEPFEDFRDLADLSSAFAELHLIDGRYAWVEWHAVETIEFLAPSSVLDIVWRWARVKLVGEPSANAAMPMVYHGTHSSGEAAERIGRASRLIDRDGLRIGLGHRRFGTESVDLVPTVRSTLRFATPAVEREQSE